jgi:hypothetical protein
LTDMVGGVELSIPETTYDPPPRRGDPGRDVHDDRRRGTRLGPPAVRPPGG